MGFLSLYNHQPYGTIYLVLQSDLFNHQFEVTEPQKGSLNHLKRFTLKKLIPSRPSRYPQQNGRSPWQCVKTLYPCSSHQNSWDLWMFIPLKMVSIGIDPYPHEVLKFMLVKTTMFLGTIGVYNLDPKKS